MNGAVQLESGSAVGTDPGKIEFEKRRWILINNIPDGGDLKVSYGSFIIIFHWRRSLIKSHGVNDSVLPVAKG